MWVWEVVEVVPITFYYQSFGSYLYVSSLCHAMLVDVDWVSEIHDRCEIVKLKVYLRWQLKYTSRWIEVPGYSSDCLFSFGPPPRLKETMRLFMLETSACAATSYYGL